MVAGAALALIGVFLPWATESGRSRNGLDDYVWLDGLTLYSIDSPGVAVLVGAAIMLGIGITTVAAGRVLAVAIIGIISGALGVLGGFIELGLVASFVDFEGGSLSIGVILQPIAPLISLAGAIVVTATRRKRAT